MPTKPKTRSRNVALKPWVGEVEPMVLRTGDGDPRLHPEFRALMAEIEPLTEPGRTRAVTTAALK